jgi:hypothetical protein
MVLSSETKKQIIKDKVDIKVDKKKLKLVYIYFYPIGVFIWKALISKIVVNKYP